MGFRIRNNSAASLAYKFYSKAQADLEKNIQRLASGLRINSAADDISGAAMVTRMDNQIRGLQEASKNAKGASGLLKMAESGLSEINSLLSRLRELTVQAASDQLTSDDRRNINLEFEQLTGEVGRIARFVEYNDIKLLNGDFTANSIDPATSTYGPSAAEGGVSEIKLTGALPGTYTFSLEDLDGDGTDETMRITSDGATEDVSLPPTPAAGETAKLTFSQLGVMVTINENMGWNVDGQEFTVNEGSGGTVQIGIDDTADSRLQFSIMDSTAVGLGIDGLNVDSVADARAAMSQLDKAISLISDERGKLGSVQNRLEFTMSNLANMIQAIDSSRSSIRDVDFAKEMTDMARNQILVQSSSSILAQANQINQSVLGLLK
ncbi:TPA: flagellin [Candidatus Poribacteria bacterium]|jgi:flagellin|nr:flagellin [Candidatus Poribacteria bacterium]HIO79291.1 flagellin [Candidatus Poribacteria bacterium]